MQRFIFQPLLILLVALAGEQVRADNMPVSSPGFDTIGGKISGSLDLNPLDAAPSSITAAMGSSGWYGQANAVALGNLGFRPDVELNQPGSSPNQGMISYGLGASLGGLVGVEMPDAYLWQPMIGVPYPANTTYTFSIDVDAGSLLDITGFSSRGFGVGLTRNSTAGRPGTFVADSSSTPSLLSIIALSGTAQRLVLNYTTGAVAPAGDLGIAVFGGRGRMARTCAHHRRSKADVHSPNRGQLHPRPLGHHPLATCH